MYKYNEKEAKSVNEKEAKSVIKMRLLYGQTLTNDIGRTRQSTSV